ncbi:MULTISPECIES: hypothetical protein [unclassified Meiothermus]|uniref:hypothetical protein n=1 Tax=unclassified Meiothermus TaxID=370471 RepID=UPI000D7BF991|nr:MULTISPECIES: hypothetical protein [unclassified Meiothermus]PZA08495.1 hypothetical protein DNA98_00110 [Meiothermus sp. Pnk-1]RYM36898.1 hypothetical protein EWH23_08160 [Meiothermus sp. PNK-Is4]
MTPREWIQHMIEANREALQQLPFPPDLAEYVDQLVKSGQTEQIISLMKMGYLLGIQQGVRTEAISTMASRSIQA